MTQRGQGASASQNMNSERLHGLALAFESEDSFLVLQIQAVGPQLVDRKCVFIQQQFAIADLPHRPRIGFGLDM